MTRVAVYCGAYAGKAPVFIQAARDLGNWLVAHHYGLVYGGGGVGLMGILAKTVLLKDGQVTGIMPQNLFERGAALDDLQDLQVVKDMAVRKQTMLNLADVCVALPGGVGTLEEIVEAFSWARVGDNQSPCVFYNVADYWAPVETMFDQMVTQGFLSAEDRQKVLFTDSLAAVDAFIADYTPPTPRRFG